MNILLITSGLNTNKSSSWLVFSKFVRFMRKEYNADIKIICLSPKFFNIKSDLEEKTFNIFLNNGLLVNGLKRVKKNYLWIISKFYAKTYSNKLIRYIEQNKIDKLWVKGDLITFVLLEKILEKKVIPYHISVFDDPFMYQGSLSFIDKASRIYKKLFSNAVSIDTPTSFLYDYYERNNIINRNAKTTESFVGVFKNSKNSPKIKDKVRKIALTGSVYGIDAMIAFLSAVKDVLYNEKIEFHLITNTFNVHIKYLQAKYKNAFDSVKIMPFIPEHEIIEELQNYDLLYLPMKFEEIYRFQTDSSFPSKTHNYLASQVPIILHAPNTSSIYNFFIENEIGCVIDTLEPSVIASKFLTLLEKKTRENLSIEIGVFNKTMVHNNHVRKLFDIINA